MSETYEAVVESHDVAGTVWTFKLAVVVGAKGGGG